MTAMTENFQGWNGFHITCSQQQNITFNDWSFREIPQFLGWQEMKKKSKSWCGDVLAADEPFWPPETSFSYLGCFVFILHKMAHFQSDCEAVVR